MHVTLFQHGWLGFVLRDRPESLGGVRLQRSRREVSEIYEAGSGFTESSVKDDGRSLGWIDYTLDLLVINGRNIFLCIAYIVIFLYRVIQKVYLYYSRKHLVQYRVLEFHGIHFNVIVSIQGNKNFLCACHLSAVVFHKLFVMK